ncbi:FAD:protein FMN transferase [Methylobacterium sp. A54F]
MTGAPGPFRLRPAPERRRLLLGAAGGLAALGLGRAGFAALARARGLVARTRAGTALGTTVALTVAGPSAAAAEAALDDAMRAVRAVEGALSLQRPDSALARLNRDGRLDAPDPLLDEALGFALDLAAASGGAFDPTVQPLWPLWAEAAARGTRPDPAALAAARARIGWGRVRREPGRIFLEPGTALTLNGIAQGLAADRAMAALTPHAIADAFLDTGEFGARGAHADGSPWRLGIADPRRPGRIAEVLDPFTGFAATSGDYATAFSADFSDHHIFDPATGRSPRALAAVTVRAGSGLLADGLSTAAMVLGPEAGARLVARYPGATATFTLKACNLKA